MSLAQENDDDLFDSRPVSILGVGYDSITNAAIVLDLTVDDVLYRIQSKSPRYARYQFMSDEDAALVPKSNPVAALPVSDSAKLTRLCSGMPRPESMRDFVPTLFGYLHQPPAFPF